MLLSTIKVTCEGSD